MRPTGRCLVESSRTPSAAAGADHRVTVVILTRDRLADICRTLEETFANSAASSVIVVDNGSSDGTPAQLAQRFPGVRVIPLPRNLGAAGRNLGVRRATTPYVALCDDDTWWAAGALSRAADLLDAHPRLAVLTGRILVGPDEREDPACAGMGKSPLPPDAEVPGVPVLGFMAGACMIRRAAFLAVGGFERRLFIGGEERLVAIDLYAAGDWPMCMMCSSATIPRLGAMPRPAGGCSGAMRCGVSGCAVQRDRRCRPRYRRSRM